MVTKLVQILTNVTTKFPPNTESNTSHYCTLLTNDTRKLPTNCRHMLYVFVLEIFIQGKCICSCVSVVIILFPFW